MCSTKSILIALYPKPAPYNRFISITAEVDQKITTSNEVNTIITGFLDNILTRYPTYNYKLAGEEDYRKATYIRIILIQAAGTSLGS